MNPPTTGIFNEYDKNGMDNCSKRCVKVFFESFVSFVVVTKYTLLLEIFFRGDRKLSYYTRVSEGCFKL